MQRPGPGRTSSRVARLLAACALLCGPAARGEDPAPTPAPGTNGQRVVATGGRLDVHIRDLEISTLIELLSRQAKANIVASTSVSGQVSANLYGVTLPQALNAILRPNKYAWAETDGVIFVGTPEEVAALGPEPGPPSVEVFALRYITTTEAAMAVKAVIGETTCVVQEGHQGGAEGGDGKMGVASSNYLVVSGMPAQLEAARRVLAQIDVRPKQVLVEATVLRATLSENNTLGIDFVALSGVDFRGVGASSNAASDIRLGDVPDAKFENSLVNLNTNFTAGIPDGGFTFGLIKNNIGTFVRALEEVTDVVVVANPKIVALNRQEGEVIVGRRDGYLTTTVTETAAVQKVEFLETGTQIKFRPFIYEDNSVRMFVHPKDSNGGLTSANLPFEETTEATADILVNDGDTVLIGGLFRERATTSRQQIPVLGDIPWLGLVASNRTDQTTREEVIILLTVRVMRDDQYEQDHARQLIEDIERTRVGIREGILPLGRERLAQAFFHQALKQLDAGNTGLALLNARMTLHNQPKHINAMKLAERLDQQRAWDDEGTRMRAFMLDLIQPPLRSQPPTAPPFERPPIDPPATLEELKP